VLSNSQIGLYLIKIALSLMKILSNFFLISILASYIANWYKTGPIRHLNLKIPNIEEIAIKPSKRAALFIRMILRERYLKQETLML
jgi:hypothetical protein